MSEPFRKPLQPDAASHCSPPPSHKTAALLPNDSMLPEPAHEAVQRRDHSLGSEFQEVGAPPLRAPSGSALQPTSCAPSLARPLVGFAREVSSRTIATGATPSASGVIAAAGKAGLSCAWDCAPNKKMIALASAQKSRLIFPIMAASVGPYGCPPSARSPPVFLRRQFGPPHSPPSGPRSITQSAHLIISRLCSITTSVLPASAVSSAPAIVFRYRQNAAHLSVRRGCRGFGRSPSSPTRLQV